MDSDSTESELFYHDQRKLFNGKSDEKYVREHFALLELKSGFENLVIKNKFCYMDISVTSKPYSKTFKYFTCSMSIKGPDGF